MSENNVAFRLERYDKVSAISLDRHLSTSPIPKRLANFVGNYGHHAPLKLLCRIGRKGCVGSSSASKVRAAEAGGEERRSGGQRQARRAPLSSPKIRRCRHRRRRAHQGGVDPLGARADARMSSPWRNTVQALTDHSAGGGSPRSGEAPGGEPIRRIGEEMPAADSKIADQTPRPAIIRHLNVQIVGAGRERDGRQAVRYRPIVALSDQPARIRAALTDIDDKRIVGGQAAGQCRGASACGPCRTNGP